MEEFNHIFNYVLGLLVLLLGWIAQREIKRNDKQDENMVTLRKETTDLAKDVQSVKDIHTQQITNLFEYIREFKTEFKQDLGSFKDDVKTDMKSLQNEVHANKNMDGTLNHTLKLILEHLISVQKNEKHN